MNRIGIMQGRLSPAPLGRPQTFPWATWQREFRSAADCGFDGIEWLVTADDFDRNPLCTDEGVREVQELIAATGVRVMSVCADCFIAQPFVRVTGAERQLAVERLSQLIDRVALIGAQAVVVPVIENGAIRDQAEQAELVNALQVPLGQAKRQGVRIALESDLPAAVLHDLISGAGPGTLACCYDTGNAAAQGNDLVDEVRVLAPMLASVHVKDRRRQGPSVPLGEGDADLAGFFQALSASGYAGSLILETPVGSDPQAAAHRHFAFVQRQLSVAAGAAAHR